jgi:hypothetical protein
MPEDYWAIFWEVTYLSRPGWQKGYFPVSKGAK